MPEKNNKNILTGTGKMKRKKFFLFSGTVLMGILALKNIPSTLFRSLNSESKTKTSLKITENPNAVKRKSRQADNG